LLPSLDALHATSAAVEEGVMPGGGSVDPRAKGIEKARNAGFLLGCALTMATSRTNCRVRNGRNTVGKDGALRGQASLARMPLPRTDGAVD
jgi:hypothetical protein